MDYNIFVKFGAGRNFELRLQDRDLVGATPQSARRWFEEQFAEMGCTPTNPTGKTLLVDLILGVARAMGEKPFANGDSSAREFARNAIAVLQRSTVSIDIEDLSVR
jgi:hypothetical protein